MEDAYGVVSNIEALERENEAKNDEIQNLKSETDSLLREAAELEWARSEEAEALREILEERERAVTFLEREIKGLKQANVESEMKVRDLERKLSVLEVRESEERSKRIRAEKERREKVAEKESEIEEMKQRIEDLERVGEKEERVNGEWRKGLGLRWPVLAAGGAVAALFYLCFRKRSR